MSWTRTRLKYLCVDSGQYGLNISADQYVNQGIRLIRTTDISSGVLKPATNGVYVDSLVEERHRLQQGDLLVSRSGTPPGQSYSVQATESKATYAGYLIRFRPRPDVDARFLSYVARSSAFQQTILAESVSSTIQNFNAERYANISIVAPSPAEQRRIADFLDAETAQIDRLTAARTRQRAVLDERYYADASEAMLPGSLAAARGSWPWYWLPDVPEGSPLVRLGYVCRIQNGLTVDGSRDVSGDTVTRPYLRVANVQAGYVDLRSVTEITVPRETAERCTLRSGDVLMTEGGDLDKLGRGTVWDGELPDCLHQNHVFALRPEPDRLDGEYLALMTQSMHGRCYFESTGSKTTNLASTNSSKILSFPIPLPSVKRQRELVRSIRNRFDLINRTKQRLDRQLELLAERRRALITAAVTGSIDVAAAGGRGIEE